MGSRLARLAPPLLPATTQSVLFLFILLSLGLVTVPILVRARSRAVVHPVTVFFLGARMSKLVRVSRRLAVSRAAAMAAALTMLLIGIPAMPARAALGDSGFEGPSYLGTSKPASGEKPESKLWYAGGLWWAVMWDTISADWHIFQLDRTANRWIDTGVLVDKRNGTRADVLYSSSTDKVYIASHVATTGIAVAGNAARLMRYSYRNGAWRLDRGFPKKITDYSSETLTIDEDSIGNIWATWTQAAADDTGAVYAARGADGGLSWSSPFLVPSADAGGNRPRPDDISTVVSFGSKIGVLWSNQRTSALYWSIHADGAGDATWTTGTALKSPKIADDHINIKSLHSDGAGRVYAVFKTNYNDVSTDKTLPQVMLATYRAGGVWTHETVWTIGDCVTRPLVMLDESAQLLHVMGTAPETGCGYSGQEGVIFEKTVSLRDLRFGPGRGTILMKDADSPNLNNVSGSKQAFDSTSGQVLLATNSATKHYWHSDSMAGLAPLSAGSVH